MNKGLKEVKAGSGGMGHTVLRDWERAVLPKLL